MAFISVSGVFFWGNVLLFGRGVAGMTDPTSPLVYPFPFFCHLVMCYDPTQ
jgi:hypothetical protein